MSQVGNILGIHVIETGIVSSKSDADLLLKGIDKYDEIFSAHDMLANAFNKKSTLLYVKSGYGSLPVGFLALDRKITKNTDDNAISLNFSYDVESVFVNRPYREYGYGRTLRRAVLNVIENDIARVFEREFSNNVQVILKMNCMNSDSALFAQSLVKECSYMTNQLLSRKNFNKDFKINLVDDIAYDEYSSQFKM